LKIWQTKKNEMIQVALDLLLEYFPTLREFLIIGAPSIILAFSYLFLAGILKKYKKWRTGYTRKVFHFFVFITASIVQAKLALTGTIVFGTCVSIAVFYAIWKGDGNIFYEAMAREKDAPKRSYYIIAPFFATLFAGIFSNILFTLDGAAIGYLATGFGDAIGEPVGTRFGKHTYKVPSLSKVTSFRSYEGSLAVFIACFIAIGFGAMLLSLPISAILILKILIIALATAIVEGISPHGWDNFTTQLVAAGLFYLLFIL
jgi:phytol kinase